MCSLRYPKFWNLDSSFYILYFSLERWSAVLLWAHVFAQCLDNPIGKTKNCRRSLDAHFHDGVMYMSCAVSDEKAARTLYMNYSPNARLILAMMQDHQSVTFQWFAFSGWCTESVATVVAPKGGQYLLYGCLQPIACCITQDARPKIIDTPLTLIFRMGQTVCCFCFCHSRQPIPYVWMAATNRHFGYPRCTAKNRWRSVDAHFQNGVVTLPLAILSIKAANTLVLHNSNEITFQLLYLQDL